MCCQRRENLARLFSKQENQTWITLSFVHMIYTNYQVSINYSLSFVIEFFCDGNCINKQYHSSISSCPQSCQTELCNKSRNTTCYLYEIDVSGTHQFLKNICEIDVCQTRLLPKSNTILCINQFGFRCLFIVRQQAEHHCCISRFLKSIRHS